MIFKDEIISQTEVRFGFKERVKILFGKTVYVDLRIKTEHLPGCLETRSGVWVARWFPKKSKGGVHEYA